MLRLTFRHSHRHTLARTYTVTHTYKYSHPYIRLHSFTHTSSLPYASSRVLLPVSPVLRSPPFLILMSGDKGPHKGNGKAIPLFSIVSNNVNGLSAYPCDAKGGRRRRAKLKIVNELRKEYDVIFLQETKLNALEDRYLDEAGCRIFYSNKDNKHAGCVTIIGRRLLLHYEPELIDLPGHLSGHVLQVYMRSKSAHFRDFVLDNLYLSSGSAQAAKRRQLSGLVHNKGDTIFMGGDFNFTESLEDGGSLLSGPTASVWHNLCSSLGLREVYQGGLTFSRGDTSSRLDRFYCNLDEADRLLYTPMAYLKASGAADIGKTGIAADNALFTDHHPVSMRLFSTERSKNRGFNCPRWIAKEEVFVDHFRHQWTMRQGKVRDPFERLALWKRCVVKSTKHYFKTNKDRIRKYSTNSALISRATRLLRLLRAEEQDLVRIHDMLEKDPLLKEKVSLHEQANRWDEHLLCQWIRDLLADLVTKAKRSKQKELFGVTNVASDRVGPIETLKKLTPCSRTRMEALRCNANSLPTNNPQEMALLIDEHWSPKWDGGQANPDLVELVNNFGYAKTIVRDSVGRFGVGDFEDAIRDTNNSCSGPDGIPFSVYREFYDVTAPLLFEVAEALAAGTLPPDGMDFNYARLFLIPKGGTMLPLDHRPISVANSDNRIIAKVLVGKMADAVGALVENAQKGFVPGRNGEDNINGLLNYYYSKLDKKAQAFILLLDIEKAFDSMSHDYIHLMLEKVGMPKWLTNMVRGLMHDVRVSPVLSERTDTLLAITRGVKQGCPLSPFLFIICYDPLLWKLSSTEEATPFGFADDLAAACDRSGDVIHTLNIFKVFSAMSGLRLNESKTTVVTHDRYRGVMRAMLDLHLWTKVKIADRGVYLGIAFGEVTTRDIYDKALTKFRKRLRSYSPIFKSVSIQRRTLLANVFLLSLFSYVGQFYVVPPDVYLEVKEGLRRLVIPFAGSAFAYAHAVSTTNTALRLSRPLKDLWALNLTTLASKTDLSSTNGSRLAVFDGFDHVNNDDWGTRHPYLSLRPIEHRVHAALVYLDDFGLRAEDGSILSEHLKGNTRQTRSVIYDHFASQGWREHLNSRNPLKVCYKIKRWGFAGREEVVHRWSEKLRPRLPPQVWDFYFRLLFRALPFEKRLREAHMKDSKGNEFRNVCYFCHDGEDGGLHVFKHCPVVQDISMKCLRLQSAPSAERMLLADPNMDLKEAREMVLLTYSIWRVRLDFLRTSGEVVSAASILRRVYMRFRCSLEGKKKKREINDQLASFLREPPPEAALYFTDGSASPNPGPCGAGLYRQKGPLPPLTASVHLGFGSNNEAELYAIGMALSCILDSGGVSYSCIFTDSDYAHGLLERNHRITTNKHLAHKVKDLLRRARESSTIFIVWIKAHVGHEGNEEADSLAAVGASPDCPLRDLDKEFFLYEAR